MFGPGFSRRLPLVVPSTLYFVAMFLITIFYSVSFILGAVLPYEKRYRIARCWGRDNIIALRLICGIRLQLVGFENVPQHPFILYAKHQSSYEIMALMSLMGPTSWVAKRELLRIPIFGWAFGRSKPITIDRSAGKAAVNQLVGQGCRALEEGRNVLIFPEGTRTRPGTRPNYRIGGAVLAEKSTYPILPVAHNAGEYWPRHSFIKWPGTVTMVFGPLIHTKGKTAEEILAETQGWIEGKMQEISNPANWHR